VALRLAILGKLPKCDFASIETRVPSELPVMREVF
jgi:hypothetical protein